MKKAELDKLLRTPAAKEALQREAVEDPALWLAPEEAMLPPEEQARRKDECKAALMRAALMRAATEAPARARMPRAVVAAAVCLLLLAGFFTAVPAGRAMAQTILNRLTLRKVPSHILVENHAPAAEGQPIPGGIKVPGVDGFDMHHYQSVEEFMEETGLDPLLLPTGWDCILNISDTVDVDDPYTLTIVYRLPDGRPLTTNERFDIPSFSAALWDGTEAVEADVSPARASTLELTGFVLAPPVYNTEPQPEPIRYESPAAFTAATGYVPVVVDPDFAAFVSLEQHVQNAAADWVSIASTYEKDGQYITIHQDFGHIHDSALRVDDETYQETPILDGRTLCGSLDPLDGSYGGMALLEDSKIFLLCEKGIDLVALCASLTYGAS